MPDPTKRAKYWESRARSAEDILSMESHMNSFMIGYLKQHHPAIHSEIVTVYSTHGKNKSSFKMQCLQERRRERMNAAS